MPLPGIGNSQNQATTESLPVPGNYISESTLFPQIMGDGQLVTQYDPATGAVVQYDVAAMSGICAQCNNVICQCDWCDCGLYSVCGCTANPPWWVRGELLRWTYEADHLPALVTTSPLGTDPQMAGVLGEPTTSILFGGDDESSGPRVGGRFIMGMWFNEDRRTGFQAEFIGLDGPDRDFFLSSDGDPIIARPFFNTDPLVMADDAQLVALQGLVSGAVTIDNDGQLFSGALSVRRNTRCNTFSRFRSEITQRYDLLTGYRYFHFDESLSIAERFQPAGTLFDPDPDATLLLTDRIKASNDFHGTEFGLEFHRQRRRIVWEFTGKFAFGVMRRRITASGDTEVRVSETDPSTFFPGGFYIPADGIDARDRTFTLIPHGRIGVGYFIRHNLRIHLGYDFLYLTNVVRPSHAIDTSFDANRLVGGGGGGLAEFRDTDMVVQGLSTGLTWNF